MLGTTLDNSLGSTQLQRKYAQLISRARDFGQEGAVIDENDGVLTIEVVVDTAYERDVLTEHANRLRGRDSDLDLNVRNAREDYYHLHTIEESDSLASLANRYYGDTEAYTVIYDANVDLIPDPARLIAGSQLIIPQRYAETIAADPADADPSQVYV